MKGYRMSYEIKMLEDSTADVRIYGEISSTQWWGDEVTASGFAKDLDAVKDAKRLNVYLNTPGGDVFQAMAMRSELLRHKAEEKHVYVTGLCASAGTLLLCLPKEVQVHMYKGSMAMIHHPSTFAWGNAGEIQKTLHSLEEITNSVVDLYHAKTGLANETLREYMDAESFFTAERTVELGFAADVVQEEATGMKMQAELVKMLGYKNVPEELVIYASAGIAQNKALENKKTEEKESRKMTLEELRQQEPQLCEQLIAEGAALENARLMALDEVDAQGYENLLQEAKYGQNRMDAASLCFSLNKAQKQAKM